MGRTHSDEGLSPIGGTLYEIGTISEEEEGGEKESSAVAVQAWLVLQLPWKPGSMGRPLSG